MLSPGLATILMALVVGIAIGAGVATVYFKVNVTRTWSMPDGTKISVHGPLGVTVILPAYQIEER